MAWDDLRFVLELWRAGTAVAAAKRLGVNATTVARRVKAVESVLETRLFDRSAEGQSLTPAGEAAIQAALRMEEEAYNLDAEVRGLDAELRGTLRLTSMECIFELWRRDLARLTLRMPQVELALASTPLSMDLGRREADIAVRVVASPPEALVGRKHTEVIYAVYGSDELLGDPGCEPDYSALPWVGWDEPFAAATDAVISSRAPGARVPLRINSMSTLGRALQDGVGISVMPCFVGDRLEGVRRSGDYLEGGTYLWVLTRAELRTSARVRAVMSTLHELIARDTPIFAGQQPR